MREIKGDATRPQGEGQKIIVHICNDIGGWGKGFVLALNNRWFTPKKEYQHWHRRKKGFKLGAIQMVRVEEDISVCNLIGQRDIYTKNGVKPIRYAAVRKGLTLLAEQAKSMGASVHMPLIGCGLAGGSWAKMRPIIEEALSDLDVTVYRL